MSTNVSSAKKLMPLSLAGSPGSMIIHQSTLPNPISLPKLKHYLQNYDFAVSLIAGFSLGFTIPSSIQDQTSTPANHKSVQDNADIIQHHIDKALQAGRIEGPFLIKPFYNFISSPLGLVPRKATGQFCLIHDPSFPKGGSSVNSNIPLGLSSIS